jgi:hypothetical protein
VAEGETCEGSLFRGGTAAVPPLVVKLAQHENETLSADCRQSMSPPGVLRQIKELGFNYSPNG